LRLRVRVEEEVVSHQLPQSVTTPPPSLCTHQQCAAVCVERGRLLQHS
jgi:hypothetical protein